MAGLWTAPYKQAFHARRANKQPWLFLSNSVRAKKLSRGPTWLPVCTWQRKKKWAQGQVSGQLWWVSWHHADHGMSWQPPENLTAASAGRRDIIFCDHSFKGTQRETPRCWPLVPSRWSPVESHVWQQIDPFQRPSQLHLRAIWPLCQSMLGKGGRIGGYLCLRQSSINNNLHLLPIILRHWAGLSEQ